MTVTKIPAAAETAVKLKEKKSKVPLHLPSNSEVRQNGMKQRNKGHRSGKQVE